MILEFIINENTFQNTGENILDAWKKEQNKVFILKSDKTGDDIRNFYEFFCTSVGKIYDSRKYERETG